ELRLVALEGRIDADLRMGRHGVLVGELEALLVEHPTREGMARQLMLALYRSGRQDAALDIFHRTRIHLSDRLGLEPGPALQALQAQILTQAPSLVGTAEGSSTGPAGAPWPVGVRRSAPGARHSRLGTR